MPTPRALQETLVGNLRFAATTLARENIKLLVEPINTLDIPGFFLNGTAQAVQLISEVRSNNLFVQYDIYHMQIMEGDLARTMQEYLPQIAHIQLADNPGRHEPGTGEINYPFLFRHLDAIGYRGWIGCEYKPRTTTLEGLSWHAAQTFETWRTPDMIDIGFIGLGTMGRPMAGHLLTAGHRVFLHDVGPIAPELVSAGGVACKSAKQVAEEADAVIIMVPDTPHVEAVLFGKDGVASGISKGKIVVDMSSISPLATKEFAKKIEALGADYLDAPVSGGEVGAKAASLTIMVGGPERAFNTMKGVFDKMGKNVTRVGANGDGQTTKVANQIIVALTIGAVSEALLFASKAGADPALVRQALMGGFASSRILEVHGERMVKRNFDPGFRIELHQKDLNLALEGARSLGLSLPNTAVAQQLFSACTAHGGKAWDHSAMVRALELMAGHEIAAA